MRIKKIYFEDVGVFMNKELNFDDEWNGGIHSKILISGTNGSGKTLIFRTISTLLEATYFWINHNKVLQKTDSQLQFLTSIVKGCVGLIIELNTSLIGIYFGKETSFLKIKDEAQIWVGEIVGKTKNVCIKHDCEIPNFSDILFFSPISLHLRDSLYELKRTHIIKYKKIIDIANFFLYGKIITEFEDNIRVKVLHNNTYHQLIELSSGEIYIITQIYRLITHFTNGCVIFMESPDNNLHSSMIQGFIGTIESLIDEINAQFIITSHNIELCERYEAKGLLINL